MREGLKRYLTTPMKAKCFATTPGPVALFLFGLVVFFKSDAFAQTGGAKVLVFSKTAAFRHDSIPNGIAMVQALATTNNFAVDATEDATVFTDASLAQYQAVIFLCTTGDVLDGNQQAAFERYIRGGGGYVGIHSASDTEYTWPWYGQLVGAYFKSHPAIQQATVLVADRAHPSTAGLPKRWVRTDEWYNFQSNPRGLAQVLATLDEKTYAPGTDAMGFDHPTAWCHQFDGGRAWYTGGGHTQASYSEPLFQQHVLGGILWAAGLAPADAGATIDANFQKVVLDATPANPMELAVAKDGRVFYAERGGRVKIWKPNTQSVVVAGQLPVFTQLEDGLLGITLDPGFETNNWLYLFCSPQGAVAEQFISRFTMVGDALDLASEKLLLVIPTQRDQCCHSAGSLTFGPAGDLYISVGDNTNPFESDGYAPLDERAGRSPWDSQKSASNANDLRGKILRIHPEPDGSYTIPSGNLFPPGTANTRPEIYAMGDRNPFRIAVDAETGWLYWGEVGPDAGSASATRGPAGHDEWNQARGPGNYGWPYFVGDNKAYLEYDFASGASGAAFNPNAPANNSPNNTGPQLLPPARPAWIWYPYSASAEFPEVNGGSGRCAMGGPVYHYDPNLVSPRKLPRYYDKTVFIYEWSRNWIKEVKLDDNGDILKINPFLPSFSFRRPMEMEIGPDGAVYMIEWGSNFGGDNTDAKVIRLDYVGGNRAPTAAARATPDAGSVPLFVQFSSAGTYDPDANDTLTFAWSFLSDGVTNATGPNPTFTYTQPGNYTARLSVTDSAGNTGVANVAISAGNNRPAVTILSPPNGAFFDWNEAMAYSVIVTDAEDGSTTDGGIPCADVVVQQYLGHNDHSHPLQQYPGCASAFDAPGGHGTAADNLYLIIEAAYLDQGAGNVAPLRGVADYLLHPKLMQAEYFTAGDGVIAVPTGDLAGGGLEISGIDHGDFISFAPMNLTNMTAVTYRVAAGAAGGRIEIHTDSPAGPLVSSAAIPDTGGAYADITTSVADPGGTHEFFFLFQRNPGDADLFKLNWLKFSGDGVTIRQTPYGGNAATIPGTVQAEDFDEGGEGVSYHDLTPANDGGQYRVTGVDIEAIADAGGGFNIASARAGEWLEYSVEVAESGIYRLDARVASSGGGGLFHLEFDGIDKTGPLTIPDTAGWQTWQTITQSNVALNAGRQVMRLAMESDGLSGFVGNFNYLAFALIAGNSPPEVALNNPPDGAAYSAPANVTLSAMASDSNGVALVEFFEEATLIGSTTTSPFNYVWTNAPVGNHRLTARATDAFGFAAVSAPVTIAVVNGASPFFALPQHVPGTIQAEDFDQGGEGAGYHDTSAGNSGAQYRATDVDIEATTDSGGGYNVGWTSTGEWLEYSLFADIDGDYRIDARVAADSAGATVHLDFDGVNKTGPMVLPFTGGWQVWQVLTTTNIALAAGPQVMRLFFDNAVSDNAGGNINWIQFTATSTNVVVPVLQSAVTLSGSFDDDPSAVITASAKTITIGAPSGTRFYRLRCTKPMRITGARIVGGNVALTYE